MAQKKKQSKKNLSSMDSDLFDVLTSIRFQIKNKIYEVDVGSELLVDGEDIHSQVERIPAVMGYFGSIVALLEEEYRNKKTLVKKIEASIDKLVRESGMAGEQRIEKAIKRHPKWLEANVKLNKAQSRLNKARSLQQSLKEKSIVLMSRSADIRGTPSDSIRGVSREDIFPIDDD